MAKAYCSVVLDHSADDVWQVIRPFDHYAWAGVESETVIEEERCGDQVGAVRRVAAGGNVLRQRLLAHSDHDRSYTYCFADQPPFPVRDYVATIRVAEVIATGMAFVEWWATFDCELGERDVWVKHFEERGFANWLAALREFMRRTNETVEQSA